MHRRTFLMATASTLLVPQMTWASQRSDLTAAPVGAQILPEGNPQTPMLGYNGATPGPVLRFRQGEVRDLRLINQLDQPTAVHWHGVRLDNAMDGVPGLTQDAVQPGDSFDYSVRTPDAGTYWYHSHNRSSEQVAKGLFGPLIVEESAPPDVDHDIIVLIDDWRLTETGARCIFSRYSGSAWPCSISSCVSSPEWIGSRPVYLLLARSSAIACTSRMCNPQNSAICSKVSAVLSTSQEAVACGMRGVGCSAIECLRPNGPQMRSGGAKNTRAAPFGAAVRPTI